MNKLFRIAGLAVALVLSPMALATEEAAPAPAADAAEAPAAPAAAVQLTASGDHVVKVNSGNETVDAAANTVARCAERSAAYRTCDAMSGFKAMGCRKLAEMRYKDVECSL